MVGITFMVFITFMGDTGDSAYLLKPWLLCPFKDNGALNREQKKFNELSKAIIVSKHAYGLTKGRQSPTKMVKQRQ